jgi:MFS family permease
VARPAVHPWLRIALAMVGVAWGANQFAPLIPVYRARDHLTPASVTGMLAIYGLGLVPVLFWAGSFTHRYGPRRAVRLGALLSLTSTLVMCAGNVQAWTLYPGRFLAGVASAFAFAAGSLWIRQVSHGAGAGSGARRATVALSAGFGAGPLIAGAVAQWLPAPALLPYLLHAVLMLGVTGLMWRVPGPAPAAGKTRELIPAAARSRRFLLGVVPWAPWVFGAPSVGFTILPAVVADHISHIAAAFAGGVAGLVLMAGIAVQPLARRLGTTGARRIRVAGLSAAAAGLAGCALTASTGEVALVPAVAIVLGSGYGLLFVLGLLEVERLAEAHEASSLVACFYALTYLGIVIPFLLSLFAAGGQYTAPLLVAALLPLLAVPLAALGSRTPPQAQPPAVRLTDVPVDPSSYCPLRKS